MLTPESPSTSTSTTTATGQPLARRGRRPHRGQAQALALLRAGITAPKAAALVGASSSSVRHWAHAAGVPLPLPPQQASPPPKSPRRERGEELIRAGQRDCVVAAQLGVSRERVRQWRVAIGIQALPMPWRRVHDEIDALLLQGQTLDEVMERTGASRTVVCKRRRKLGLYQGQRRVDLVGREFGRLTALRLNLSVTKKRTHWWCRCRCGAVVSVLRWSLVAGRTRSCGCLRQDTAQKLSAEQRRCREMVPLEWDRAGSADLPG